MFELQFVFTEEPSLLRGNSKRKSLTLARNKAHASRHGHVQRKKAMLECMSKVKKSREQDCAHHNFHRPGVNELLDWDYDEKVLDAIDSGLYTSRPKPTAVYRVATLESSLTPYPTSLYLTSTYGHREASRINRLFDFLIQFYGPNYIWRIFSDEGERQAYRADVMSFTLSQPAFLESLLALLHLQYGVFRGQAPHSQECGTREHLNRAIGLMRTKFSNKGAYEPGLIWTIVCIVVVNQEMNDWDACKVNLRGLEAMMSTREAVAHVSARESQCLHFLRTLYQQRHKKISITNSSQQNDLYLILPTSPQPQLQECSGLPVDWPLPPRSRHIDSITLAQISCVSVLSDHHEWSDLRQRFRGNLLNIKLDLVQRMWMLANTSNLQCPDFFVALGVLCLIIIRSPQGISDEVMAAIRTYVYRVTVESLPWEIYRESCVVWAAYLVSALPAYCVFSAKERSTMLHQVMLYRPTLKEWSISCVLLEECYIDETLLKSLKQSWRRVVAQHY